MKAAPEVGDAEVVRAPNHLGDVVMALPALAAGGADVVVVRWLAPLLEMAGLGVGIIPLDRGMSGWTRAVGVLRRGGYRRGVLLTPAFSAAWLFRWGGVARLRGTRTDARGWLLADTVEREALRGVHRINQYRLLMRQPADGPVMPLPLRPPEGVTASWRERLRGDGPLVGLFPGSNAPARRWPAERFGSVARRLTTDGARVAVLGGGAERDVTGAVVSAAPGAIDLGGETDLPGLAAVLSLCDAVVTNDTGPMHLAGALGTPTVSVWGPSDPGEVRPVGAASVEVHGSPLPCRPCYRNECPRVGKGTVLPQAHEECMRLIEVDQVVGAARSILAGAV